MIRDQIDLEDKKLTASEHMSRLASTPWAGAHFICLSWCLRNRVYASEQEENDRQALERSFFGLPSVARQARSSCPSRHASRRTLHGRACWRHGRSECHDLASASTDSENALPKLTHLFSPVQLFSCIFVKSKEADRLRDISLITVKTGMGGRYGNKGAILSRKLPVPAPNRHEPSLIRIELGDSRFRH